MVNVDYSAENPSSGSPSRQRRFLSPRTEAHSSAIGSLFQPVDPSCLAVFRVLFGLVLLLDLIVERGYGSLPEIWADTHLCHFPLFDWWPRLPLEWLYVVYFAMFVSAIGICLGLLFRISTICFAVCYWYVFLSETTVWNNHTYLYGLICLVMAFSNANHAWSVDGLIWPSIRNKAIPSWNYSLLKFQIFIVYFYAGIKKLDSDWVQGYSMQYLSQSSVFGPFRILLTDQQIDFFIVHLGGLFIDLTTGFLLLNPKTRFIGLAQGSAFHIMNSTMFNIGMFPYAMLSTMVLFLPCDWPKKVARKLPRIVSLFLPDGKEPKANYTCSIAQKGRITTRHMLIALFASHYIMIQLTLPFSHSVTKGYNSWSEGLYGYSWDMMVKKWQQQHFVAKVVDGKSGDVTYLQPGVWLSPTTRLSRIGGHPDIIKKYAQCVAGNVESLLNITQPEIYFDVWRSMNKRFQQRAVDPHVDLLKAPWSPFTLTPWYMPLLAELTPWREKFNDITERHAIDPNTTDVVFVADFPGLFLENFIEDKVEANITVLKGEIMVQANGVNTTFTPGDIIELSSNETHLVHTVSTEPACYMYTSRYQEGVEDDVESETRPPKKTRSLAKLGRVLMRSLTGSYAAVRLLVFNDGLPFNELLNNTKTSHP